MEGRRILIAEGEAAFAEILAALLRDEGATVSLADTAAALDAGLAETAVDIVLLDTRLSGGDGFVLAERVRGQTDCGLILMSPRGRPTDREKGLALGADAVLIKPFGIAAAVDAIRRIPGRTREDRA